MTFNSASYWEKRYAAGGNSGKGSYNHLAIFKAKIINDILCEYNISSVVDYGVGDGNQCSYLNTTNQKYYGIDQSKTAIDICKSKNLADKEFMLVSEFIDMNITCDISLSCDVIYHLIENDVYEQYMYNLFKFSNRFVLIYAKDEDINHCQHVKFRNFSTFIKNNFNAVLLRHIPNEYPQQYIGVNNENTSPSDFYLWEKQ